jgi:hypothetical protein
VSAALLPSRTRQRTGPKPAPLPELLAQRTEPTETGGHLRWTGYLRKKDGVPIARYRGTQTTGYRLMWILHTGQVPEGTVLPTCDLSGCVAFEHLAEQPPLDLAQIVKSTDHLTLLLTQRTEPVEPGGHLRWTSHAPGGIPTLRYAHSRQTTAYRFTWYLHTGQNPPRGIGPTCDLSGCVAFEHLGIVRGALNPALRPKEPAGRQHTTSPEAPRA